MGPANVFLGLGAASAALAVTLGALGAHALKARLDPAALATFETAVTYHFFHSIGLCIVALWLRSAAVAGGLPVAAGWAFAVGIVLFSGSLYGLSMAGPRWLGPITPLGGVAFILGWILLAVAALRE
jgi:uncharacterized membrane protein YgdD (TMEM256/DUF423 family)